MVSEGTMQAAKGQEELIVLSSCDTYKSQQCPKWQDSPKGATVALVTRQ